MQIVYSILGLRKLIVSIVNTLWKYWLPSNNNKNSVLADTLVFLANKCINR
jgi:hypothetical protein